MPGVTVSYSGVHQAYQIALAADEAGMLDKFYCSLYSAPGFVGGALAAIAGPERMASRRLDGLDTSKVEEYPWPLLCHEITRSKAWFKANDRFDRHVSKKLRGSSSKLFIGVETCAQHSFIAAERNGMLKVLDCPGIDSEFLDQMARQAAEEFGLTTDTQADSSEMKQRKEEERALADVVLVCSEFQARTMKNRDYAFRVKTIPLWIDTNFWKPAACPKHDNGPLRVLFAGKISVRKGIPYLLKAVEEGADKVELTLVGDLDADINPLLGADNVCVLSARPKANMLAIYQAHDVFVLPSLGDAFGIAAVEAMACGLPVIVSDHCGVPVPNPDWRVPAMQSNAIRGRLMKYFEDRQLLENDSRLATDFAGQFPPEKYRSRLMVCLQDILGRHEA